MKEVTLHTNHRRPSARSHRAKHEGQGSYWPRGYSFKWWRNQAARTRRREELEKLGGERWDELGTRYPRTVLWDYH
jgi:hypothetical protein